MKKRDANAGMQMQGCKCRDANAGMQMQGCKCRDANAQTVVASQAQFGWFATWGQTSHSPQSADRPR
jgi:hypothetical protein